MNQRWRAVLVGLALADTACLIEPNPDFIEPTVSTETGALDPCSLGMLDCDAAPGCEADPSDPSTCGSCSKRCELAGQQFDCVEGECVGTLVFSELADAYVDVDHPSMNFGFEPSLFVDQSRSSYIALPDFGGLPNGAKLEHVGLHLSCTQVGTSVALHRVESGWDERQLTASNAPSGSATIGTFDFELGENVIELAGKLPSWRASSSNRGLQLSATGPDPQPLECSSREGPSGPRLAITLSW